MKKIVLMGDSIRLGYDVLVRDAFRGVAEVYFPSDNCCFAAHTLRWMDSWKDAMRCGDDVDAVHWNAGLWDNLRQFDEEPFCTPEIYAYFMERVCRRMEKLYPRAKKIFATSTPVLEERFEQPQVMFRRNSDVEIFNEAALKVVTAFGHEVNDLHAVMAQMPPEYHSDAVHFYTRGGTEVISRQVCAVLEQALDVTAAPPPIDKWYDQTDCYEGLAWLKRRVRGMSATATLGT